VEIRKTNLLTYLRLGSGLGSHAVKVGNHVHVAHLLWTYAIDAFEITIKVADLGIAAIAGNGLDGQLVIF
jgi:hypothetical protein